jgi:hypothetical protein
MSLESAKLLTKAEIETHSGRSPVTAFGHPILGDTLGK